MSSNANKQKAKPMDLSEFTDAELTKHYAEVAEAIDASHPSDPHRNHGMAVLRDLSIELATRGYVRKKGQWVMGANGHEKTINQAKGMYCKSMASGDRQNAREAQEVVVSLLAKRLARV